MTHLITDSPIHDLAEYRARGGGSGLSKALARDSSDVVATVRRSGLRGRGGAGFPAGVKWQGAAEADAIDKYVVCNAAEGEPGTFKDRALIRHNPYQVLEGLAIAAHAIGAATAYVGTKAKFEGEIERIESAAAEMAAAGMLDHLELRIVAGPDDYLLGEEKGMLEVIEGRDPLPRLYPPYVQGLFADHEKPSKPTIVNNVETLAHVPHIVDRGADWFRGIGTASSPGTMVFTISGDVERETVAEMPLGTPLSLLIYGPAQGMREDRRPKLVISGASNRPLTNTELDVPLSFEAMEQIGSGLGAGGFLIYDESSCVVEVAAVLSGFLEEGSCGQCPPCKLGTNRFHQTFRAIHRGEASAQDLEDIVPWLRQVTDANRCGLGAGQRNLARGILYEFADEVVACLEGRCRGDRGLRVPSITDWDEGSGRFQLGS